MKYYKKSLCVAVILMMILTSIISVNANIIKDNENKTIITKNDTNAKWTIMIYMACDAARDHLTDFFLKIFTDVGSSEDVNLIVLSDGLDDMDTVLYYVHKDLLEPISWYEPESDMGNPLTLLKFINLTKHLYPADNYALFTQSAWGSGWQGVISDTNGASTSEKMTLMTIPETADVLKKVTNNGSEKIDVWGIDVCIPGMIEVAYEISPYVEYMVANEEHGFEGELSEEGYPLEWNYSYFLSELRNNPDMVAEDFSILIVDSYKAGTHHGKLFFNLKPPKWYPISKFYTTLSAIELSKMDKLKKSVNNFSSNLTKNIDELRLILKNTRKNSREYGKLYRKFWFLPIKIYYLQIDSLGYNGFIDFYDFVNKTSIQTTNSDVKKTGKELMNTLNETIIANEALPTDNSYGLGIYFPEYKIQYDHSIWQFTGNPEYRTIPSSYENLAFTQDTSWDEFIKTYLNI